MIFASPGHTTLSPHDRMNQALDAYAAQTDESVYVIRGDSSYPFQHAQALGFVDRASFLQYLRQARAVVLQGGSGSIIDAIEVNVPIIIFPRLLRYGECEDDSHVEFAEMLQQQGRVLLAYTQEELFDILQRPQLVRPQDAYTKAGSLVGALRESLDRLRSKRQ